MAIDLRSGNGLFDRLGRIGYVMKIVQDFFAGSAVNQLEKEVNDVLAKFDGASNVIRSSVDGLVETKSRFQLDPEAFMLGLKQCAETTFIEMAHADNPLQEKTIERALEEVAVQMTAASETIDANEPTVTVTAAATNEGVASVVASLVGTNGRTLQCVYPEDITLTVTSSVAQGGTIAIYGEASLAENGQSVFWPDGSAASTTITVINPASDGYLINGGFENWTAGVLDTWTAITGTLAEETTIKQFGAKCAKVTGNGSTLHQVRQDVTGFLEQRVNYVATIALRLSSVPAAGVLVLDLFDGTNVINDDNGTPQTFSISLTTGISTTAFTTVSTVFRLPSPKPTQIFFRIRFSTALSNTVILYLDSCSFGVTPTQLYTGGPYLAVVSTASTLSLGDKWTVTVANDLRGAFQTLIWQLFNLPAYQLPSNTAGTETISDALIG